MYTDANNDGSDERYYYHANHLYSVAAITNESGTVIERYGYDAYGAQVVALDDPTFAQPYGFTGRRLDDEQMHTLLFDSLIRLLSMTTWDVGAVTPSAKAS